MTQNAKKPLDLFPAPKDAPEARQTKRQMEAVKTKNKIFAAAVKIINEHGFNNISVEDITTVAKVAKGSFYTHFESKNAVVAYIFQQSDEVYLKAYKKVCTLDFLSMVTGFLRISYMEHEKRGKGIIKAMVSNYFSESERNLYSKERALLKCLAMIVESGKENNVLDAAMPTDWYVTILVAAVVGVEVMWCFDEHGRSLADMVEDAARAVAKGLMRTEQPAATET